MSRRAGCALHVVFLGGLGAVFGVQALKRLNLDGTTVLIVGAALVGMAIALAVWRLRFARSFLTVLVAAPFVFLGVFLFGTSVEKLVFPNDQVRAAVASVRSPTPVVILIFDEFPVLSLQDAKEEIDAGRFPNFTRLARSSIWFRNMTTISTTTTYAVPAMLTGKVPRRDALPVVQDYPNNLFTLLGRRYRLHVIETQTRLCPPRLCKRKKANTASRLSSLYSDARVVYLHLIAPPALEERLPAIDESWGDFGSDTGSKLESNVPVPKVNLKTFYLSRLRDFNTFLGRLRSPANGSPTLDYLHVLLPHGPWLYLPDGRVRAVAIPRAPGRDGDRWRNEAFAVQAWQRHLLQVGFTDRLLGRFLDRLHQTGLWDRALVVVTADEGDSFRGGDSRDPTRTNLAEVGFIPLFVRLPGQRGGRVVERHVTTLNVLPTIAAVLGVKVPWKMDGRSALTGGAGPKTVRLRDVEVSYPRALAQRRASLARQLALFDSGNWGPRLSALGEYWRLVGQPVDAFPVTGNIGGKAVVDSVGSKLLRSLRKGSPLVPSPVTGTLSGVRRGATVAVALNGRIAAVTVAYVDHSGPMRFSALAPESSFRVGRNVVRTFLVSGPASSVQLRELPTSLSG